MSILFDQSTCNVLTSVHVETDSKVSQYEQDKGNGSLKHSSGSEYMYIVYIHNL